MSGSTQRLQPRILFGRFVIALLATVPDLLKSYVVFRHSKFQDYDDGFLPCRPPGGFEACTFRCTCDKHIIKEIGLISIATVVSSGRSRSVTQE